MCLSSLQWRHFMQLGLGVSDERLQLKKDMLEPNKCCALIYTVSSTVFY